MPAVTLQKRTVHSSQNCLVRMEFAAETDRVVTSAAVSALGVHPSGFQSGCGTRMLKTPMAMTAT